MPQILRGDCIKNDNIAIGQPAGRENVAIGLVPSGAYPATVLADGAALFMRLDEASGTIARSQVGGYTGTITGGVLLNQLGPLADGSAAMRFDGVTGRIAVPVGAYSSFGTAPLSLECWVSPAAIGSGYGLIDCGKVIGTNGIGAELSVTLTGLVQFSVGQGAANLSIQSLTPLVAGAWSHVAAVYVASTGALSIYINGVLDKTQAFGNQSWTINASNGLALGSSSAGTPALYLNGRLDNVAIYQGALTPTQIATHYALRTAEAPALQQENIQLGNTVCPYGVENIRVGIAGPNPEIP